MAGRLRQRGLLFDEGLLTEDFNNLKVAQYEVVAPSVAQQDRRRNRKNKRPHLALRRGLHYFPMIVSVGKLKSPIELQSNVSAVQNVVVIGLHRECIGQ